MPDLKLPVTVAPVVPGPTTHGVGPRLRTPPPIPTPKISLSKGRVVRSEGDGGRGRRQGLALGRVGPEDGTLGEGLSGVRLSCQIQAQDSMEVEIINRLGRPDPGSRPEDSIQPEPDWTSV